MDDASLMVDGNAIAGTMREVFIHDMTSARIACAGCGEIELIGAEHAYVQGPGIVLRCCHCEDVLLVMTRSIETYVLGFRGCSWIEIGHES